MTISEEMFEQFCSENRIPWERIPVSTANFQKRPDYRLTCSDNAIIAEVKELGISPDDQARIERLKLYGSASHGSPPGFDPKLDVRVRKMIDDAMPQLKQLAKGKYPAIVVVHSGASLMPIEGLEIRLAMYGQDIVEIGSAGDQANTIPIVYHRFGKGRKVDADHNTTLSAVVLLTNQSNRPPELAFYHNKYAAIPFHPDWLRIPEVKHYQIGDHQQQGGLKGWELV